MDVHQGDAFTSTSSYPLHFVGNSPKWVRLEVIRVKILSVLLTLFWFVLDRVGIQNSDGKVLGKTTPRSLLPTSWRWRGFFCTQTALLLPMWFTKLERGEHVSAFLNKVSYSFNLISFILCARCRDIHEHYILLVQQLFLNSR